uniref:Venom peptide U17-SYTX-Sth1a n=1 Tax=Scytodes thoracica TaxID=1112478 RepID=A0A0A0V5D2_SCYTH|nr:venom peptide U17-SYTX-Sth1a [Scytodes thoracica]
MRLKRQSGCQGGDGKLYVPGEEYYDDENCVKSVCMEDGTFFNDVCTPIDTDLTKTLCKFIKPSSGSYPACCGSVACLLRL